LQLLAYSNWYAPVGSAHFFRRFFENLHGRSANNQAELDNWDLNITSFALANKFVLNGIEATDICSMTLSGENLPTFNSILTVWGKTLLGLPLLGNILYRI